MEVNLCSSPSIASSVKTFLFCRLAAYSNGQCGPNISFPVGRIFIPSYSLQLTLLMSSCALRIEYIFKLSWSFYRFYHFITCSKSFHSRLTKFPLRIEAQVDTDHFLQHSSYHTFRNQVSNYTNSIVISIEINILIYSIQNICCQHLKSTYNHL